MECYQPAGSFKIRGIGALCVQESQNGCLGLLSSSGGNAGLAVAYSGRALGVPTTIVVPSTTPESVRQRMRDLEGLVLEHGDVWDESDVFARQYAMDNQLAYIHPFDDPVIWTGHGSLVTELSLQGPKPDVIICSVGGGGLLCGIMDGLEQNNWSDVPVIAVETTGAASLNASVQAGKLVSIPAIRSIAKSLGAKRVAQRAFEWTQSHPVHCVQVTDRQAVDACLDFADRFRVLVEPACGAALAMLHQSHPVLLRASNIVVVVCGGNGISMDMLLKWQKS